MNHEGKVVVVTGGAKGIGRGIVERFAREGASVVVIDIDEAEASEVATPFGERALVVRADVTHEADLERATRAAVERFGRLDVMVNNVGIIQVKSLLTPEQQAAQHGEALWTRHPDQCCELRKVEPLTRVLKGFDVWITGIRRDQSPTRAHAKLIEWDQKFQLVKVNPLAAWTWEDVWTYIRVHEVPYNELHDRNYPSIGCTYCTSPVNPGDDPRAGRWKNFTKTECGLHKAS